MSSFYCPLCFNLIMRQDSKAEGFAQNLAQNAHVPACEIEHAQKSYCLFMRIAREGSENFVKLYFPFVTHGNSDISINYYTGVPPTKPHMHDFHELVLIVKGSCRFIYQHTERVLVPGDVYLIEPHYWHHYVIDGPFECYNLMYYSDRLGTKLENISSPSFFDADRTIAVGEKAWIPANRVQWDNIIHFTPQQALPLQNMMKTILEEQEKQHYGFETIQKALVEVLLVTIKRMQCETIVPHASKKDPHALLVEQALIYIENHLVEPLSIEQIAARYHMSHSHFRRIFKQAVGLPPLEYINRLRIVKSLAYFQQHDSTIAEAAAAVGISDANYYSRLFKKVIGYSPKYFKDHAPQSIGVEV